MGFGNRSSQASSGIVKRSPASVVKKLERELRRHCKMISVDEHLISNLHSCCHRRKKQMYQRMTRRDGVMWSMNMHSVLHYDNVGCRGMTMIRDVNARHNIPLILRATPGRGDAEWRSIGQRRLLGGSLPQQRWYEMLQASAWACTSLHP